MNSDPLSAAYKAMEDGHRLLSRSLEESRQGWNDEARKQLDRMYCEKIREDSRTAVATLKAAGVELRQAIRALEGGH